MTGVLALLAHRVTLSPAEVRGLRSQRLPDSFSRDPRGWLDTGFAGRPQSPGARSDYLALRSMSGSGSRYGAPVGGGTLAAVLARCVARGGRGKKPRLSRFQESHLVDLHHKGEHTTTEIAELFGVARSTVYRAIQRDGSAGCALRRVDVGSACRIAHTSRTRQMIAILYSHYVEYIHSPRPTKCWTRHNHHPMLV